MSQGRDTVNCICLVAHLSPSKTPPPHPTYPCVFFCAPSDGNFSCKFYHNQRYHIYVLSCSSATTADLSLLSASAAAPRGILDSSQTQIDGASAVAGHLLHLGVRISIRSSYDVDGYGGGGCVDGDDDDMVTCWAIKTLWESRSLICAAGGGAVVPYGDGRQDVARAEADALQ